MYKFDAKKYLWEQKRKPRYVLESIQVPVEDYNNIKLFFYAGSNLIIFDLFAE